MIIDVLKELNRPTVKGYRAFRFRHWTATRPQIRVYSELTGLPGACNHGRKCSNKSPFLTPFLIHTKWLFLPKPACKSCPFGVFKVVSAKNTHGWLLETHTSANAGCHRIFKCENENTCWLERACLLRAFAPGFTSACVKRHMRMPQSAYTVAKPPTKKDHLRWTHHLGNDLPEHRVNPYFAEHHLARKSRGKHGLPTSC